MDDWEDKENFNSKGARSRTNSCRPTPTPLFTYNRREEKNVTTSGKRKRALEIKRRIKQMTKMNLNELFKAAIVRPVSAFVKDELLKLQRDKMEAEYHRSPSYKGSPRAVTTSTSVKRIEFSSKDFSPHKPSLREELKAFAEKYNPSEEFFEDLVRLMERNGVVVPRNVERTTDSGPQFEILVMSFGRYLNFGIENRLKEYLSTGKVTLDLAIYVQKMAKTLRHMIILGRCKDETFLLGLYEGDFPSPIVGNQILTPLVNELMDLKQVEIGALVCDPIAASLVTCTSLPDSLYGCGKCCQRAELQFNKGLASYPTSAPLSSLRHDDDFRIGLENSHHLGKPVLSMLGIGLVSQLTLDYREVICVGVMRSLLNLWMNGRLDYRLNKESTRRISAELLLVGQSRPKEFRGIPKTLNELDRWDAYDYRQFILYYGPVVLKHHLDAKYFVNFLCLTLGVRLMLSSPDIKRSGVFIGGKLFKTFVYDFAALYGADQVDFNVHQLLHFEAVVTALGPIEEVGGFRFERTLADTLDQINAKKTLEQIGVESIAKGSVKGEEKSPFIDEKGILVLKTFSLSAEAPDNHAITKDGVIRIEGVAQDEDEIVVVGRLYQESSVIYQAPLTFQQFSLVSNLSSPKIFKLDEILMKGVYVTTSKGYCVMPMVNF